MGLWSEPLKPDSLGQLVGSKYPITGGRKDLAMEKQRSFSVESRRQVIEELHGKPFQDSKARGVYLLLL